MMNKKGIIVGIIFFLICIELNQGRECFRHDFCLTDCPDLSKTVVQCQTNETKCWKVTSPVGTKRGCGDGQCKFQIDIGILNTANVCCQEDRCNSSTQLDFTRMFIFVISLIVFLHSRMF